MSLPRFSIRRPVTTIMIYLGVTLLGVIAWTRLPQELFPPITYPQLTVVTRYKDAAPEEVEILVTKLIEEVTGTVSGLRRISSISKEELSLVIAEFNWGTNMDFASLGVREKIDLIKERLPRGAEEPVVIKYNPFERPVLILNLSGEVSSHELLTIARKQLKNELEKVDGVAAVNLAGGLEREILVEVDQGRLQAAQMPIGHVVDSLSRANLNYPAGTIKEAFYEYLIRTIGEFEVVPEIPNIAVGTDEEEEDPKKKLEEATYKGPLRKEKGVTPEQRIILLKHVATVKDTFRERESISRFKGEDNVSLSLQKQANANTLQLVDRVKELIEQIRPSLPSGLSLSIAYDQSLAIRDSIAGVRDAAIQGGFLAFLVLYLFLGNPWAALNVAFAIPISILATVTLMYFSGTTINIISLGGLALGTGMLVDAGVVVVENVTRHREAGSGSKEAAARGTEEVASAIGGSVLTTIVVFLPMVFVVGIAGQIFKDLAYTVTFSLLASWVVSLTITCLVSSRIRGGVTRAPIEPLLRPMQKGFLGVGRWFLRNPALGVAAVLLLFAGSVLALGVLDREVLPRVDQGQLTLQAQLPPGTRLEVTDRIARRIEQVLTQIPEVRDVTVTIGSNKEQKRAEELLETLGAHQAQIIVNLWPRLRGWQLSREGPFRLKSTAYVVQDIREMLAQVPLEGAELEYLLDESVFKTAMIAGAPIVVEVQGADWAKLEDLSGRVKEKLKGVPGLYGVRTSLIPPSPETKVHIMKDRAATYHLSVSDIALAAQTALEGFVATKFKEEGKEVDIRVRLRPQDRNDMNRVRNLLVHSPLEVDIPLAEVAYFALGKGPTELRRMDQQRTILISAQLFRRSLSDVLSEIGTSLASLKVQGDYRVALTGESEQMQESFRSLAFALVLSIVLVYMVMASEFESLWQPFLVMGTIPMALIGVVVALTLTATPVSIVSVLGFIVLGGVVVNNGIVLIDYVNLLRSQGMELEKAVLQASQDRLRPVLMTSGTTILGLVPLALGLQEGVELQVPMAITVMGGLSASTFLTLIFLPTLYVMGAKFFARVRLTNLLPWQQAEEFAPAAALAGSGVEATPVREPAREEPEVSPEAPEIPKDFGGEEAVPQQGDMFSLFYSGSLPQLQPPELEMKREEESPEPELEPEKGRGGIVEPTDKGKQMGAGEETSQLEPEPPRLQLPPPAGEPPPLLAPSASESGEGKKGAKGEIEAQSSPPEASPPLAEKLEGEGLGLSAPLNPRQQRLIEYLKEHGRITRREYVTLVQTSVPTAARDLKELVDRGLIQGIGPLAKGRYYVLSKPPS